MSIVTKIKTKLVCPKAVQNKIQYYFILSSYLKKIKIAKFKVLHLSGKLCIFQKGTKNIVY